MDLIGHCLVAEMSGRFHEDEIYGPGIVELMFLNYAHCHDWAYASCWNTQGFERELEPTVQLLRAHMLADWVIHYGPNRALGKRKKKKGWAYRRMMIAGRLLDRFFADAERRELLVECVDPGEWDKKRRLDFNHSLVEYAVDFVLAPRVFTPKRFRKVKEGLSQLCHADGYGGREWAWDLFGHLGATSDRDRAFIEASMMQLGQDAVESNAPEEFAVRTSIHKYHLKLDEESVRYVRSILSEIAEEIDPDEVDALLAGISESIRETPLPTTVCIP